ncbi:hypothetical protein [Erythrobacter sp.]|jgi:hypothetical protein|uniref:hypothetical protein n=1 Tax=Erythrobacter sp. TaxID=1042 RepID=UPI002EAC3E76|nr:hypothetical protein [Erythrobacter sp.]
MSGGLRLFERIWRVRSSLPLEEDLSTSQVFERLDPLFQTPGTEVDIAGDTLTYSKANPAAQDKLATFTSGTLTVTEREGAPALAYDVRSTALWVCFLAPLFFAGMALLAMGLNTLDPVDPDRDRSAQEESEEAEPPRELHWIDQMLGAPAPETEEEKERREAEEGEDEEEAHDWIPGAVLAVMFIVIFAVGRVLEPYLLRRTLRTALRGGFVATPEGPRLRESFDQRDDSDKTPKDAAAEAAPVNENRERRTI